MTNTAFMVRFVKPVWNDAKLGKSWRYPEQLPRHSRDREDLHAHNCFLKLVRLTLIRYTYFQSGMTVLLSQQCRQLIPQWVSVRETFRRRRRKDFWLASLSDFLGAPQIRRAEFSHEKCMDNNNSSLLSHAAENSENSYYYKRSWRRDETLK